MEKENLIITLDPAHVSAVIGKEVVHTSQEALELCEHFNARSIKVLGKIHAPYDSKAFKRPDETEKPEETPAWLVLAKYYNDLDPVNPYEEL